MSRRKRHAEHANHERWLVSYADFITLLFAIFVVMFASSQVDKRKVGNLALAIQVAFQRLGMFNPTSSSPSVVKTPEPFAQAQMIDNEVRTENLGRIVPSSYKRLSPTGAAQPKPDRIRQDLEHALAKEIAKQQVDVRLTHEGLIVSLREVGFFDSGSATLKPAAPPTIARVVKILLPRDEHVRIEGHTDNVPIHNAAFRSNWELSTARAAATLDLFITQYGFPPERLSTAGYAEFHPVASNDTPDGRAKNRRVDIVVLNPRFWGTVGDGASSPPTSDKR
jgi:chemotaxis protein MotB